MFFKNLYYIKLKSKSLWLLSPLYNISFKLVSFYIHLYKKSRKYLISLLKSYKIQLCIKANITLSKNQSIKLAKWIFFIIVSRAYFCVLSWWQHFICESVIQKSKVTKHILHNVGTLTPSPPSSLLVPFPSFFKGILLGFVGQFISHSLRMVICISKSR